MREKLHFGRYDYACYSAFSAYSLCSLAIPLVIVEMGKSLDFPLDAGGMAAGGGLHLLRSIAMVLSLLFCGVAAGRFGKRRTMGSAMILMAIGIGVCAIVPGYFWLLPFLVLAGIGEGICEGLATPFVQDLHTDAPERYVNMAHGMWSVGIGVCVILSSILLSSGAGWRWMMFACGIAALGSAMLFLWRENPAKRYPENPRQDRWTDILSYTRAIGRTPRFWVYCLGMFMGAGAEFCLTFWAAAYLRLHFGASVWVAALGTGAIAAGMFLGRMGFGYFARKQYLKHILLWASLGTIPITLLLGTLTPEMFASPQAMVSALLALLFLGGIGIAPYWPTLQVYGVGKLPELDSTMLYIYFSGIGVPGCGFFAWLMGVLGDHFGLQNAFLLIPGTLVVFAAIILLEGWIFPRRITPEAAEE